MNRRTDCFLEICNSEKNLEAIADKPLNRVKCSTVRKKVNDTPPRQWVRLKPCVEPAFKLLIGSTLQRNCSKDKK